MRFAYADPPYPGKAHYYRDHPDFGGEVDHAALIARLEQEFPEGWALSTDQNALQAILPLCPQPIPRGAIGGGVIHQFRILSWCKPRARPSSRGGPFYGWEPVILRGGRRDPAERGNYPRDFLTCSSERAALIGAKPRQFSRWLFECAGLRHGDEFVDLFPGTGGVGQEWETFSAQLCLPAEDPHAAQEALV